MKQLSAATGAPIRVLVTDDSPIYRRLISDALTKLPNVEVVGTSFDGEDCLRMLEKLKPHFVTLDINMPRRDGLSTLEEIRKRGLDTHVVMVSSPTPQSAEQTMRALRNGALDMIFKPEGDDIQSNRKSLEMQLFQQVETVRSLAKSALVRSNQTRINTVVRSTLPGPTREPNRSMHHVEPRPIHSQSVTRKGIFECLCIGISTGGPAALGVVLPGLPAKFPVPIFIVQHMPAMFTKSLAEHLAQLCSIRVSEAVHGERPEPGHAYIAPGGKQMKIVKSGGMPRIEITDEEYDSPSKPSVDCLFESVHSVFGKSTLALIMTGMGCDGLRASRMLHSAGAHIIAQSADTCVVYGMPRQIVDNHLASEVVPLPMMATRIGELLRDRK
ncbi:Chemotaxis response regulator protein-glutamate methylesterase of group 1 operon [Pirellula sp. SH-Sr6A]|uniref:protein-glutamate methylesterase/protein-glutamine glutaminase n=1 Tax=Pirellula sp. SH-Sr6A TaxID=1632865 RepID=UPI00078C5D0C|nr:chemotaxis response regulator protein-glutamate methylesterase [Pirellula sp. SH-Sr6A]AMV30579.1 Chemotaxis response regulator protein-glutamate methylesterase of group 1 operon [Pirellula sp. SH-Sr6A]